MSTTPRFTPLPPISSPTPTVASEDDDDSTIPDDMEVAFPALKRRIQRLNQNAVLTKDSSQSDCYYVYNACETWARDAATVDKFCKKMVGDVAVAGFLCRGGG